MNNSLGILTSSRYLSTNQDLNCIERDQTSTHDCDLQSIKMLSTGLIENIFWVKFSSRSTTQIAGLLFLEGSIHDIIIFSIFFTQPPKSLRNSL